MFVDRFCAKKHRILQLLTFLSPKIYFLPNLSM